MDIQKTQRIANHILQRLAKYAEFNKRLTSEVTRVQIYNQESLLNLAKLEIPLDIQSISDKILLINSLLKWFKFSYFKWVNNLPCDYCNSTNTVGIKAGHPTQEDLMYGASRIEQYQCTVCSRVSRFPRYNDPKILMKTRRGRCGEWANVFTLFCRAVGFRARYVLDYTDHVWTEVYIDSKWMHCDSCEPLYDSPLVYESGWGKQLSFIFALESTQVVDVIKRYSRKDQVLQTRNREIPEFLLSHCISSINSRIRSRLPILQQQILLIEQAAEQVDLKNAKILRPSAATTEKIGRESGSIEWRTSRAEVGDSITYKAWNFEKGNEIVKFDLFKANTVGSATVLNSAIAVLTPDNNDKVGSINLSHTLKISSSNVVLIEKNNQQSLNSGFILDFAFQITKNNGDADGGADGMALVFHKAGSHAIGRGGSGLGYEGIPSSIAIEIDTYQSSDTCDDPNSNHISFQLGNPHHQYSKACVDTGLPRLNDGREYYMRVMYKIGNGFMIYLSDDGKEYEFLINVNHVLEGEFWIAFTASTGGLCQKHQVSNVVITSLK